MIAAPRSYSSCGAQGPLTNLRTMMTIVTDMLYLHCTYIVLTLYNTGHNVFTGMGKQVVRNEGVLGLYNGISASIGRQMTYSLTRFAVYERIKVCVCLFCLTQVRVSLHLEVVYTVPINSCLNWFSNICHFAIYEAWDNCPELIPSGVLWGD